MTPHTLPLAQSCATDRRALTAWLERHCTGDWRLSVDLRPGGGPTSAAFEVAEDRERFRRLFCAARSAPKPAPPPPPQPPPERPRKGRGGFAPVLRLLCPLPRGTDCDDALAWLQGRARGEWTLHPRGVRFALPEDQMAFRRAFPLV